MTSDPWPFPGDAPLARARRIAVAYRALLEKADPEMCDMWDRQFAKWGQTWMLMKVVTYDVDDWLEPGEAAEVAMTTTANLRRLRASGRLKGKLGTDGKWRYQAREVLRVMSATRTRKG